jgi:hypothetical protein
MRFNVTLLDPPGYRFAHFLHDVARMLQGGLEELGLDASLSRNTLDPDRMNVLVGVHHLASAEDAHGILTGDQPYVVYQTEIVTPHAVEHDHAPAARVTEVLLPLLRGARAVWDSSRENVAALGGHGVRADLLGLGYTDALREIRHKPRKDIDFFFFGSLTAHRKAVLGRLAALGYRVEVAFDAPAVFRNDLIARAEVVLTLRQSEAIAHVPHARVIYLVNNACLVAGDGGLEQAPLEDVFLWGEPDEIIEVCREARARKDRRELAESFRERLSHRRMRDGLAPLVEALG